MNAPMQKPLFAWPGWPHVHFAFWNIFVVTVWFCFIFGGADWLTAHRTARVRIDFNFESHIPLVPAFTVVYMSIYLLFLAAPFVLRTRREITTLARAQVFTISIAGICFLLIPAQLEFPPASDAELGIWRSLFRTADWLNLDYNLVPSLHVALSIVCIEMFCARARTYVRIWLRAWGALIAASTVLTHQHHIVDMVIGYLLAFGIVALVCVRHARTAPVTVPPSAPEKPCPLPELP